MVIVIRLNYGRFDVVTCSVDVCRLDVVPSLMWPDVLCFLGEINLAV